MRKYTASLVISEMRNQQSTFDETIYGKDVELFQPQHQSHTLLFGKALESSERMFSISLYTKELIISDINFYVIGMLLF